MTLELVEVALRLAIDEQWLKAEAPRTSELAALRETEVRAVQYWKALSPMESEVLEERLASLKEVQL